MFCLEGTYLGLVLNPLQKLFRCPSASSEEFVAPGCNLVDFSSPSSLSLPYRLKVALLLHCVEQRVECSGAEVDFESVTDLQVDLVSPSRLCLEKPEYDEVKMILDKPLPPRFIEILVQQRTEPFFVGL